MGTTPTRSRTFVAASSQYLDSSSLPASAVPLSIVGWFKPVSAAATYELATIEKSASAAWFLLQLSAGTVRAVTFDGATSAVATSTASFTAGRWNHGAAVFTSAASRAAYLNGAAKGTNTTNVTPAGLDRFEIGRLLNGGGAPTQYMDGSIAGVAVWTTALSDDEVAMLASGVSPLRIQRSSLVFYAPNGEDSILGTTLTNHGPTASQADPTDVTWTINSVDRTSLVRRYESSIDLTADGTPDTCTFVARGFTPTVGQSVSVVYHNDVIFAGEISDVEQIQATASTRATYRCQCVDATFLLDRRVAYKSWTSTAVETIVASILSTFTSGFTTTNVQSGLSAIDFVTAFEPVSTALQRLAEAIGARWKVRPDRDIYFRLATNLTAPVSITTSNLLARALQHHYTTDQIRNRVYAAGARTSLVASVPVAQSYVPVASAVIFDASGGSVAAGAQLLTYTSKVLGSAIAPPVVTWGAITPVGGGSLTAGITYKVAFTYVTLLGETPISNVGTAGAATTAVNKQITVSASVTAPSTPTAINVYLSADGGTTWLLAGAMNVYQNGLTWPSVTATTAPTSNTAGNDAITASTSSGVYGVGSILVGVNDTDKFSSGGGIAAYQINGVTYTFTYTARSTTGAGGNLTGIPASGAGSVTVAIPLNTPIQNVPGLKGVPTGGTGSVLTQLNQGESVAIVSQRDNAGSQATMAALEGGDGIHELYISDASLLTSGACQARGDAELALGATTQESAACVTQDQYAIPGATQAISVAGITASLTIGRARVFWERTRRNPQRDIEMRTVSQSFQQVFAELQRQASR